MLNFYSFLAIVRNTISFKLRNKWDTNCCVIWNNLMSDVDTVLSGLNCSHYFDIIAGENKSFHAVSSPYARENRLLSETSDIKSMRKDKPGAPPTESLYSMKKSSSSSTSGDESSQYHRIQQQQSSQIFSSGKCFFYTFYIFVIFYFHIIRPSLLFISQLTA